MNVFLRACDVLESRSGRLRPFGLRKTDLTKVCFDSLHDAIQPFDHKIQVIGDRLSDELLDFFSERSIEVTNGHLGNAGSLERCVRLALQLPDDDWVYFLEDDYVHLPHSFSYLYEFLSNRSSYLAARPGPWLLRATLGEPERSPLFISLHDEPYNYRPRKVRPSLVFRSEHCHWRQIGATTYTFLTRGREVKRYRRFLLKAARHADDRYLQGMYGSLFLRGRALCVSPLPALAAHVQEGQFSPGFDWAKLSGRLPFAATAARVEGHEAAIAGPDRRSIGALRE